MNILDISNGVQMPQPNLDDGRVLLLSNVSQLTSIAYDTNKFFLGPALENTDVNFDKNTVVKITPYSESDYYGTRTIYYDRTDLSLLSLRINRQFAINLSELLPSIGLEYGLTFATDEIFEQVLPIVPVNTSSSVQLIAKQNSYGFINRGTLELIPVRTPAIDFFTVTPLRVKPFALMTISAASSQLKSNTEYNLKFYAQIGLNDYEGSFFLSASGIYSDSDGYIAFSDQVSNTVLEENFKIFFLLTEVNLGIPPDSILSGDSFSEILRSNRIDIVTLPPNQIFTSTIYGTLVEETLKINELLIPKVSLINETVDLMGIGQLNITGGSLNETIVYKTTTQTEEDELTIGNISIQGVSLQTTINYLTKDAQNLDTMSIGSLTISSGTLQ
jgi:hypothetical protein